jgi:hypothetical protein
VDNARALPTYPLAKQQRVSIRLALEGELRCAAGADHRSASTAQAVASLRQATAPSLRGSRQPFTAASGSAVARSYFAANDVDLRGSDRSRRTRVRGADVENRQRGLLALRKRGPHPVRVMTSTMPVRLSHGRRSRRLVTCRMLRTHLSGECPGVWVAEARLLPQLTTISARL